VARRREDDSGQLAKEWIAASKAEGRGKVNMAHHELTDRLEAYTDLLGFRGTLDLTWSRFQESCEPRSNPALPYDPMIDGAA